MLILDLSNPATFERDLMMLDARLRAEAAKTPTGFVDLTKVVQKHNDAIDQHKATDEPLKLCWHGCLHEGVECTYPDCLSEER